MYSEKIESILALFSKNEFQKALDAIEEVINDDPNISMLFNIRGACYAGLNQLNIAKENYKKAISISPEYSKAHFNLAGVLHELDEFDASIQSYQNALGIEPSYAEAQNNLGNVFKEIGQLDEAIESYEKAVAINPDYVEAHYSLGVSFYEDGQLNETVNSYKRVLELRPNFKGMHNNLGNVFRELGRLDDAVLSYEKAVSIDSNFVEVYYNLGITFQELNQLNDAVKNYKKAIQIKSNYSEAFNNLGIAYKELNDFDSAIKAFNQAIEVKPDYAEAFNNLGMLYKELGQESKAFESYYEAINIMPEYDEAYNNLGILLMASGQFDKAIESYKIAIKFNKGFIEAINNIGIAYMNIGQIDEAINYYQKAIAINPNFALTYNNLGIAYKRLHNLDAAVKSYKKALKLDPNYFDAYGNYGNLLTDLHDYSEALSKYNRAYELNSSSDYTLGNIIHTKMHLCIWEDYYSEINELKAQINEGFKRIDAFSFMALVDDPKLQERVSLIYSNDRFPKSHVLPDINKYQKRPKIRIGYFSGDFREHPVSTLTAGLYENHNREFFEVYAFSYGPDTNDEMNLRIKSGVDHFNDVQNMAHKDIALLVRSYEIAIAIDLGGYTVSGKTDVFAMSAAPIQISYIGFLGTMGAPYYDYLIADPIVIPEKNRQYYSEKIAYLPTYQVNDSKEALPEIFLTRKEIGLPESGFVFCCFNNTYKITPDTFDSWIRILNNVENSVLLIYVDLESARKNLMNKFTSEGLDSSRLIFAKHVDRNEYLARYRMADLFLDTLPYNAATTASDALKMGLPVLTLEGNSFASRMASSVLSAANLPELITSSVGDYESLAIELATNPKKFNSIKVKLNETIAKSALYNTAKFTENLESAYKEMYKKYHDGLDPDHIYVNNLEQ